MLNQLKPGRFKCFCDEDRFALRSLTILTGQNGSGKSSLIQSLLLLRQAARPTSTYVQLNGPFQLQLGRAADVFNMCAPGEWEIAVQVTLGTGDSLAWTFTAETEDDLTLAFHGPEFEQAAAAFGSVEDFTYLCAERVGPRDISLMDSVPFAGAGVGAQGEFTAQVLLSREREKVREALRHPSGGNVSPTLGKQVEMWMRDLVPGLELRAQSFEGSNAVAIRMRRVSGTIDWLRPTNIAFGVTYALPIVVAGLLSDRGSLFIVENPEAHLHPSGQSRIGRFLATLAASGVQVVVETHSDHVLNGIRLAVADDHPLKHEDVVIHNFDVSDHGPLFQEITVDDLGELSMWPSGFFDQTEVDLAQLVKVRRERRGR